MQLMLRTSLPFLCGEEAFADRMLTHWRPDLSAEVISGGLQADDWDCGGQQGVTLI